MRTSLIAIALSFAGAAVATPQAQNYAKPYSIGSIFLKHLVESDSYDLTFTITHRTPAGNAIESTVAHTAWSNGSNPVGPAEPELAENPLYTYYFPTGAPHPEEGFRFAVQSVVGGLAAGNIEPGEKFHCRDYTGDDANIDTECLSINEGEFYLTR
ncbi:hypothetical protein BJX70DRAFT_394482 [Aspergillus crustosus]